MPISLNSFIRNRGMAILFCLLVSTIILFAVSMFAGASAVGVGDLLHWLGGDADKRVSTIFWFVRLPRTLGCIVAGGSLAVAGLLLQTAMMNPLASPGIIGVNTGAGLFVVLAAALFPPLFWIRGVAAFAGGMAAVTVIWLLASRTGASRITVILSGIAVSSILAAIIDAVVSLYPEVVMDKTEFYIGGFSSASMRQIFAVFPFVVTALLLSVLLASRFDLLTLGDEVAASLGLNVLRTRFTAVLCAALLAASAVSIAGLLGFIGLIVPNIVRKLTLSGMHFRLPVTLLFGACLALLCDIISRVLFAPYELSAGIPLSLIGAPFFLWLILSRRKQRYD